MKQWAVRDERPEDVAAIAALNGAAFRGAEHSDGNEAAIVQRLRASGELALSLVAVNMDQAIVGHVAFSPVTISNGPAGWFGLGPVSVMPLRQRAGIGTALINAGLARLREQGAAGCVVLGDPAYYARFGFAHDAGLRFPGPPPEFFQRIVFAGPPTGGEVQYSPVFG